MTLLTLPAISRSPRYPAAPRRAPESCSHRLACADHRFADADAATRALPLIHSRRGAPSFGGRAFRTTLGAPRYHLFCFCSSIAARPAQARAKRFASVLKVHMATSKPIRKPRAEAAAAPVERLFDGRAITVRGAREHNLKNVDLDDPARQAGGASPACRARANRRSPSTRSMPRASAATSSRCRPMPGSSSK